MGEVARDLGIPNQTIYVWCRREAIDKGLIAGPTRAEIAELETELAVARRAMELLRKGVPPKGATRPAR